jgi:uncharacterized membrane protein HdeD (DUF308 family)
MTTQAADHAHPSRPMLHALAANWWLFLLRGLCAIAFGILTLFWPGVSLAALVLLYGAFALVDGATAIIAAIMGEPYAPRWWLALVGILGIGAGLLTFYWPAITTLVLLLCVAGWAIAIGLLQIFGAIKLRKEIDNEWLLAAGGLAAVLFGILLIARPGLGALSLALAIGAYAVIFGVLQVLFAFRLRRHDHHVTA